MLPCHGWLEHGDMLLLNYPFLHGVWLPKGLTEIDKECPANLLLCTPIFLCQRFVVRYVGRLRLQ